MNQMVEAWTWAGAHTVTYLQVFVLVVALFVVWYLAFNKKPSAVRREAQMGQTDREIKEERSALADAIFEALYKLYGDGKLSRERFKYRMHQAGCEMNLPDLLPKLRMSHPSALKAQALKLKTQIMERLGPEKTQVAVLRAKAVKPKKGNGKLNITVEQEK